MQALKDYLRKSDDIQSVIEGIRSGITEQLVAGLSGSARAMLASLLNETADKKTIIVTHQLSQAQQLYDDLVEFHQENEVFLYPVNELLSSELAFASPELMSQRIDALLNWTQSETGTLIAPVAALKRMLPPQAYWEEYEKHIQYGDIIEIDQFVSLLVEMGYVRTDMTSAPGEFSIRGGIIDIYPIRKQIPSE